ncbi:MAG: hypothetical protein AAF357_06045, partial [Verrucomicrobiota bacterium]
FLLAGNTTDLIDWAAPDAKRDEGQPPRAWYVTMANLLLLKDAADDPLRDPQFLYDVLSQFEIKGTVATHLFSELRKSGDFEGAFQVGRRLADSTLEEHGSFLVALSQVAGWAGHPREREHYLERSLGDMRARSGAGASGHFLLALTERLSLLEDDTSRRSFLINLQNRPDPGGLMTRSDHLERKTLISIAGQDEAHTIDSVSELVQRQLDVIRPSHPDPDQVRHDQSQSWQRMRQILDFYMKRIPVTPDNRTSVLQAFRGESRIMPSDESVLAEFERYEIDRQLLGFEWISFAERQARVDEMHRLFYEPDSGLDLARGLGNLGFHREAIPVYLIEATRMSRDYGPMQGVFESCLSALEPEPALNVINQINAREFPSPPGLTAEYLAEQHAIFLFLNRDLERLISLGRSPSGAAGAPPISSRSHLPYQAALVECYRLMGRDEALLRLLTHFRNQQTITTGQLLLGAELLESKGRLGEALEWVSAIQRDGAEPTYDRKALLKIADLHEQSGWPDPSVVVDLARESLENHPVSLTRSLVESAFRSGAREEAISILKMLRRQNSNRSNRSAISSQLIWLKTEMGQTPAELVSEWEAYFQDFVYDADERESRESTPWSNAAHFVEWVVRQEATSQEWIELFDRVPHSDDSEWLRQLLSAHFANDLETVALNLLSDSGVGEIHDQILETLPAFGAAGVEAASNWVDASARSGTEFFLHQPVRQIVFFHRIADHERLREVHQTLMREARSDLFHQTGLDPWFPTLTTRYRLPQLLAQLGERDLASRLFARYHDFPGSYLWNHQAFLEDYLTFLIDESEFERAESILKRVLQKTIRVDLRLAIKLYAKWGKLDHWEDRLSDVSLSSGRLTLLNDWRNALAEGREMVEYSDSW